jgi:hypothetical protein
MNDFDSDIPENDWDERSELAWSEFDWEHYLREQDGVILRYLEIYDSLGQCADRIDAAARKMGWEPFDRDPIEEPSGDGEPEGLAEDGEVYTLHKNPVYIATRAICLSLKKAWEAVAADPGLISPALAVRFLASLHRGEEISVQAIHALDFGDYAMAVSLLKRALSSVNESLSLLSPDSAEHSKALVSFREIALPRLFDLREIWLRVIEECRGEINRPIDEES